MKPTRDWEPEDVVAGLHKRGTSLRKLSKANGYHPVVLYKALRRRFPAAERIIAKALRISPKRIWPSRYLLNKRG